jgi:hypothetical protein
MIRGRMNLNKYIQNYIREKKIRCGKHYMEVDIFPYTRTQALSVKERRSSRKKISAPAQRVLNNRNAVRYLTWLINSNFSKDDLHVSLTYSEENLPGTLAEAEKEVKKFIRRLKYLRKKKGLSSLRYILVTPDFESDDEVAPDRLHHHIIMDGDLSRDEIEDTWSKRGKSIGFVNADRLQPTGEGMKALAKYLAGQPGRKQRWTSSRNLKRPTSETDDMKYRRREIEKIRREYPGKDYWERKYKGWFVADGDEGIEYRFNDLTGWSIYLKFYKLE